MDLVFFPFLSTTLKYPQFLELAKFSGFSDITLVHPHYVTYFPHSSEEPHLLTTLPAASSDNTELYYAVILSDPIVSELHFNALLL